MKWKGKVRMKRLMQICTFCIVLCLFTPFTTCMASILPENGYVETQSVYIKNSNCYFNISDSKVTAKVAVFGIESVDKCRIVLKIQKKSGDSWETVQTWTVIESAQRLSVSKSITAVSGTTYRVKATVTVWKGTSSETNFITTESKTA